MQSAEKGETAGKLLEPGDMFGDYTVEKLLGKGGMGAVYLVHAPDGERYAVKLMFPEIASKNPDFRKRFAREAEFAMKIRHKNLISVYDVGEDPDTGYCYIIMDYVPGGSVKERLAANGALPIAEAVSIAAQIALALEVAHRNGVIHRDIKPDNIMFDADGTPKLADLGVAKFTDDDHKTTVTTTGMIIGTPAYMAPEQMIDSHHIDARADIYALGIVLYEMLAGKRPTKGSSAVELLAKALKGEALPDVRTMRPEISAAIAHALSLMCAPKPEGRPATALETAHLLQAAATGKLVLPKKLPRSAEALARKKKRRALHFAAEAALAVFVSVLAVYGIVCYSRRGATKAGGQKINAPQIGKPLVAGRKAGTDATREMPTAESYVQNGLLAMWDGIENAGKGRHDPYAKVWKNLAGGPDAVPVDGLAAWSDNSALFGIGRYYRVDTLFGKPQKVTVEVCHRAFPAPAGDLSALFSSCQFGGTGFQGNPDLRWQACVANPAGGYYSEVRLPALRGKAETLAFTADKDFIVYRDADPVSRTSGINGIRYNDKYGFQIGRDPGNIGDISGEIYSIRLYSRSLAADELRRNHEIDCARFGLNRVTPTPSYPAATGSEGKTTALFSRLDRDPKAWAYSFKEEPGWYRRDFDDSRWTRAQGGFGAKTASMVHGVARMNTHWGTKRIFLRRHFSWAGGNISRVVADIFHDDGVNLYLNGLPIVSFYGHTIDWIPREIPLEDFTRALKVGDNVFCAEVTNDRFGQYFDCGLVVECGGQKKTSPDATTGIRRVATKAGTWTIRVRNGVAKIGDGRNIALDPQPKGALTIPAELDGFPVRALARDCFKRCNGLESVTIPEGVLFVEQGAFYECRKLSKVSLPGSLEYLGGGPFHESQITQIDLKNVRLMAKDALRCCGKLERVNVASGNLTYRVADGVVYDKVRRAVVFCPRSRTSYAFPDGIEEVCGYAFQRCSIENVEIPASVKGVGDSAFSECPFLESVKFHGADVDLDNWSFGHNPRLKTIVLPSMQKSLDANAIFSCAGQLESVDLPDTVETIGTKVFENCPRLKRINLGKSLRVCRFKAFASCPELRELSFPEKLAELTSSIFLNCRSLSKVFFAGNAPALVDKGRDQFGKHVFKNTAKSLVAYVREGSTGWIDSTSKLPDVWPAAGGEWARPIRRSGTLAASDMNTSANGRDARSPSANGQDVRSPSANGRDVRSPSANGRDARSLSIVPIELFPHADAQTAKWKKRAPWRYTTKMPPSNWAEPSFRDGKWKRTNKPVGFGKDAALMNMGEKWTTSDIWLRRHFSWKAAKVTRIVFEIYHDEDVEIYLNGTSILNRRGWNHRWEPCEVPVDTFMSAVREGDNVLAVKVHDNGAPRYFDCGLTVEVEESK